MKTTLDKRYVERELAWNRSLVNDHVPTLLPYVKERAENALPKKNYEHEQFRVSLRAQMILLNTMLKKNGVFPKIYVPDC